MNISILICTRNGSATIAGAIACIGRQIHVSKDTYEVIVVDNGSSDDTVARASEALQLLPCRSLLLREACEGKVKALLRGIGAASAPLVAVIDDDNQIGDEFVYRTVAMFEEFPQVGMTGSVNSLLSEDDPPSWFKYAADRYACAAPWVEGELIKVDSYRAIASSGAFAGAGSAFRKEPFLMALAKGFSFMNETLRSGQMTTGEDAELCCLFQYFGYRFGTDVRITLQHKVQPSRLSWAYARRLSRCLGTGGLAVDAFCLMDDKGSRSPLKNLRPNWWWMAARRLRRLLHLLPGVARAKALGRVIDPVWLQWEEQLGALERILRERGYYTRRVKGMLRSEWRKLRMPMESLEPAAVGPGSNIVPGKTQPF